jgi:hypothetical protein
MYPTQSPPHDIGCIMKMFHRFQNGRHDNINDLTPPAKPGFAGFDAVRICAGLTEPEYKPAR